MKKLNNNIENFKLLSKEFLDSRGGSATAHWFSPPTECFKLNFNDAFIHGDDLLTIREL